MLSIRKLTEYMKKPRSATSTFKKLTSLNKIIGKGYQPLSRFQKLREAGLVYPKSTSSKLVFISNSHGNGFRNEKEYEAPSSLGVERMKQEIDQVCYDKWKEYKQFLEKDLFANAQTATKILLAVGLLTISVLFFGSMSNVEVEEMTDTIILISTVITIVCIVSAIIIFSKKSPDYDYDCLIIGAIKQKLATFNMVEKEISLNQPRFQWSCNKDCTWIAIQLFDVTS